MPDPATLKALALVRTTKPGTPSQASFATRVSEVLTHHGDIAAEATWQQLARVIVEHWLVLGHAQPPLATWQMLARCTETVLKVRRRQKQGTGDGGEEALEEFRSMMREVLGQDERQA